MSQTSLFYTIKKGDTLGNIARQNGTTVEELSKINGIKNPDRIEAGQQIALKAEAVCGVACQLLDRDRNPIPGARMLFEYCGKKVEILSGSNGHITGILTESPEDVIKIFIARSDGSWKQITEVVSGWGNKLVTMVSPKVKISAKTMPHPMDKTGRPVPDTKDPNRKPITPPAHPKDSQAKVTLQGGDFGDGKGTKTEETQTKDGAPLIKVTKDQAALDFLEGYTGEKITEDDYEKAAKELGCEVEVIKAFAKVESGGRPGFDKINRPIILYERHVFSRNTNPKGKYNKTSPDLSSNIGYKLKKKGANLSSDELSLNYYSASSDQNYVRLAKAYMLDKNAALKACSWGKFQILGENYTICGYVSVDEFVKDHAKSERRQLAAFVQFVKSKKLQKHMKEKTWDKIAEGYNGKNYKKFKYDERIKSAYEALCKKN